MPSCVVLVGNPENTFRVVITYETLRVPVSVMRTLLTEMDSGLLRTSFPLSSVSFDSDDSP